MHRFFKLSLVVALAMLSGAWSPVAQAQQDAVTKARGVSGASPVVRQQERRYIARRPAVQPQPVVAQRQNNSVRNFSYDPNRAAVRQFVPQSAPAQPQHSGFHDAGAKVRGDFGN